LEALETLRKGILKNAKESVLMREENLELRKANEELSGRKKRKKTLLKLEGPLSVAECHEMLDNEELYAQWQAEMGENAGIEGGTSKKKRRCSKCGTLGHNSRTCQKNTPRGQEHNDAQIIQID
jgi:hypothetical protein